ncbi:uncharacterized protein LOC128677556 [Plodia interpunctella]|uniref:uncharacterized protein LOC128677556 n=1 Tax=Plodia interpunctella TaxID=58824 RepID=UPI003101A048
MGVVYVFGVALFCLSVWAVIFLTVMAFFYSIEAVTLIRDVIPQRYVHSTDFVATVKENFQILSDNCYYAAYSYVVLIVVSWFVIFQGKVMDKKAAEKIIGEDILIRH